MHMDFVEKYIFKIDDADFEIEVKRSKDFRHIVAHSRSGIIYVSAPYTAKIEDIKKLVESYGSKNLDIILKRNPFKSDGVYLFGEFVKANEGFIKIFDRFFIFKDRKIFYKNVSKYFLDYITSRVRYYENIMGVKEPYNVKIKNVKTIYGSNSMMTKSITFDIKLIHYSKNAIDSVVIHELAHDKVRDHSNNFYKVVLTYMPDYFEIQNNELKRVDFK